MLRGLRPSLIFPLVLLGLLFTAQQAAAAPVPETEPNDTIFQTGPPITPDGVSGTLSTANDEDIFLVRLRPQRQVEVNYAVTNPGTCGDNGYVHYSFLYPNGSTTNASGDSYEGVGEVGDSGIDTYTITTPGVVGDPSQPFFLRFFTEGGYGAGCAYQFTITGLNGAPTDAIDGSPPPAYPQVATGEPNDTVAQGYGPIAADTVYTGSIQTANDVDFLTVPLRGNTNATMELAASGGEVEADAEPSTTTNDYDDNQVYADDGQVVDKSFSTSTSDTTYAIKISGDQGTAWRFRITPPASVGITPVAPPVMTPAPIALTSVSPQVSISRKPGKYRGRVTGSQPACYANVQVLLYRKGHSKIYASTHSRSDGSWTITRKHKLSGGAYAYVAYHATGAFACNADSSHVVH
jgi:hypothetical protein